MYSTQAGITASSPLFVHHSDVLRDRVLSQSDDYNTVVCYRMAVYVTVTYHRSVCIAKYYSVGKYYRRLFIQHGDYSDVLQRGYCVTYSGYCNVVVFSDIPQQYYVR